MNKLFFFLLVFASGNAIYSMEENDNVIDIGTIKKEEALQTFNNVKKLPTIWFSGGEEGKLEKDVQMVKKYNKLRQEYSLPVINEAANIDFNWIYTIENQLKGEQLNASEQEMFNIFVNIRCIQRACQWNDTEHLVPLPYKGWNMHRLHVKQKELITRMHEILNKETIQPDRLKEIKQKSEQKANEEV